MCLAGGDLLAGTGSVILFATLLGAPTRGFLGTSELSGFLSLLLLLIHLSLGLYDCSLTSPVERFRLRVLGGMVFAAALASVSTVMATTIGSAVLPSTLAASMALVIGFLLELIIRNSILRAGVWGAPTVIVGSGEVARNSACMLSDFPDLGLRPMGFLLDPNEVTPTEPGMPIPCLGTLGMPSHTSQEIEVALLAASTRLPETLKLCNNLPVSHLVFVQNLFEMQSLWTQTRPLKGILGLEIRRNLLLPYNLAVKRVLDLVVAIPFAVVTLPLVALLALAIRAVDPGPAIYRQKRVGRHGKPIEVLKLRTMFSDAETRLLDLLQTDLAAAEEWGKYLKLSKDPRILPLIGAFIRRTSLDELPQLWNIIRGDMSLVGPRPFPAYHTERFDDGFQALRMSVTPGLTGFWQISSRSDGDLRVQKAEDSFYIRNWSLWLDLFIIVRTVPAVLRARGAR